MKKSINDNGSLKNWKLAIKKMGDGPKFRYWRRVIRDENLIR